MTNATRHRETSPAARVGPPTKHQLALMIWIAVFPTLTALNFVLGDWLGRLNPCFARSYSPPSPYRSSSTA